MQITIIGAGPGISHAVAELFGSKGFKVALIARNETKLKNEVAQLEASGIKAIYAVADAGVSTSLQQALNKIKQEHGNPDVILYNAYAPIFKRLEQENWESVQQQLNVNVGGAFQLLKEVLPSFKEQKTGKLFFTGGGLGLYPQHNFLGLSMGKAALRNLILGTAEGLKGSNVHLATITICGFVKEGDAKYSPSLIAEQYWRLYNQQPGEFETEVMY